MPPCAVTAGRLTSGTRAAPARRRYSRAGKARWGPRPPIEVAAVVGCQAEAEGERRRRDQQVGGRNGAALWPQAGVRPGSDAGNGQIDWVSRNAGHLHIGLPVGANPGGAGAPNAVQEFIGSHDGYGHLDIAPQRAQARQGF